MFSAPRLTLGCFAKLDLQNVKAVFDAAIKVVLQPPKQLKKKKKKQKNCSILWIVVFALELWFVWKSPSTLFVGLSQFSICFCPVIDARIIHWCSNFNALLFPLHLWDWLLLFQQNIHMALSVNQQRFGVILWTGICNIDSKRGLVLLFMNFHQQASMPSEYALEPPICVICVAGSPVCNEAFIFPIQSIWFYFVV